jgi:hypothetical protein
VPLPILCVVAGVIASVVVLVLAGRPPSDEP